MLPRPRAKFSSYYRWWENGLLATDLTNLRALMIDTEETTSQFENYNPDSRILQGVRSIRALASALAPQ
jgi:hypothetical protein